MVEAPQAFVKPYPSRLDRRRWANVYHACICRKHESGVLKCANHFFSKSGKRL